ncbi:transposase-like zinc ribbon protein [Humibacillus xanthopallidus]|uniref:Transposase-like zinc ribbon protein n=1 Tax=Humibacillus xanthopallidus TaxID=412689 RepID=A0A543PY76_9MICO|nr:IS1595 family transposase [Humibacillus xanthopallidus]TQN49033.1 transposase-like zinc ribbon protein [Humibacillus xanthopallidus]
MTANPVRGVDYPSTYQQLLEWFPDNQSCLDYLAALRWPDGFVCPKCTAREFWRTGAGLWMCRSCGRRTSVTAGTIFHRTRTPLSTWFAAIWFLTSQKNGMSALGLQRVLGFGSYETAWAWMHKLRRAMVRPERDKLSGLVELDETMIGGVSPGKPGAGSDKVPVMIAVERNGTRRLGRVRLAVAQRPNTGELVDWASQVIEPGSTVRTDGLRTLRRLSELGYKHEFTTGYNAADKASVLPGVHLVASLLKRWLIGTLHFRVEEHQLPYYLDEYTFRFNRRNAKSRGLLFYRLLEQAVVTDPHPLHELLRPDEAPIPDFT